MFSRIQKYMHKAFGASKLAQVLKEWKGQKGAGVNLDTEAKARWRDKVRQFCCMRASAGRDNVLKQVKVKYASNVQHIKALDHALVGGCGFGLMKFMPERRPVALAAGEKRFLVDVASLPADIQAVSPGRLKRSCILDKATNSTRLEVVWGRDRAVLQNCLDQGSVGWPSKYYLFQKLGLRGHQWWDLPHRRWRNVLNSYSRVGLNFIKVETTIVMNLALGPWAGAAFFMTISEAAAEYFEHFDHRDPLYRACYEGIVADLCKGTMPHNLGTEEHMEEIWSRLPGLRVFNCKGDKVKSNRWFNWCQRTSFLRDHWGALLLILLYISMHHGWYKSIFDTPMAGGSQVQHPGEDGADIGINVFSSRMRHEL